MSRNELETSIDIANLVASFLPYRQAIKCKCLNKIWNQISVELRHADFLADPDFLPIAIKYNRNNIIEHWHNWKLIGHTVGEMCKDCIKNAIVYSSSPPTTMPLRIDFEIMSAGIYEAVQTLGQLKLNKGQRNEKVFILKNAIACIPGVYLKRRNLEVLLYDNGFLDVAIWWIPHIFAVKVMYEAIHSLYVHVLEKRHDFVAAEKVLNLFTVNGVKQRIPTWLFICDIVWQLALYNMSGNWLASMFWSLFTQIFPKTEHRNLKEQLGLDLERSFSVEFHIFFRSFSMIGLVLRMLGSIRR